MSVKTLTTTLLLSAVATLSGCAAITGQSEVASALEDVPARPSAAWVQENFPLYKLAAHQSPTDINVARYHQVLDRMAVLATGVERAERTERGVTLAHDNYGRGGAAMRQPGYIHAVNEDFNHLRAEMQRLSHDAMAAHLVEGVGLSEADADDVIAALNEMEAGSDADARDWDTSDAQGYSMYEISRWERFCDNGKGMDENDWQFVNREGRNNLPDLFSQCEMPVHDYYDYLRAWERFCEFETTTERDRLIVRDSVRPQSTVSDCKALDL